MTKADVINEIAEKTGIEKIAVQASRFRFPASQTGRLAGVQYGADCLIGQRAGRGYILSRAGGRVACRVEVRQLHPKSVRHIERI